ncbi:alpha/beta fold hydrolase [Streptosporangium sp. G11]|uniref:alpha/beta fold hydrolase n=1 Tax=Streptosporangium sp. G11 TaxID=3436926 RepID=UPI003EB89C70
MRVSALLRGGAATVAAGALVALAGVSPATAAQSADSGSKGGAKPTVVLVHGAWEDGSNWAAVSALLQQDGYKVAVPANPLRGLASDAEYLSAYLQQATTGPVILVGHSYGGSVITNVSDPDVKGLVYVDAFIPDQGETLGQIVGGSKSALNVQEPTSVYNVVGFPGGDADAYVKPDVFSTSVAQDLPKKVRDVLAASQRPIALSAVSEASGVPAWKTTPSWAVVGTADKVLPARTQTQMAQRAGASITQVSASHLSMLSKPAAVTKVIEAAAKAAR